jgi:uncharacterized protein YdaU (DUF1376 family)
MTNDLQNNAVQCKAGDTPKATLWMPWFIKDHRAAASTLDHVEHSVLCYLNMLLWENAGSFPDDDKRLAKALRLSVPKWKAMREVILANCIVSNGCIQSPDICMEFSKAQNNIEQKRKAGIASARARKQSTAVERALQQNGNGEPTARQPRAGSGEGGGDGSMSKRGLDDFDDCPFGLED